MKKRWISLALALCIVLTLLPVSAFAADIVASGNCGAQGDNVTWALYSDGVLTIKGIGEMEDYRSYGDKTPWYSRRNSIKSLKITDGVTSIDDWAFRNCDNLVSVTIPGSVTQIASSSFLDCINLANITISDGVEVIESWAFQGCSRLKNIWFPDSVTSIGSYVFVGCSNLERIDVGSNNPTYHSIDGVLFDRQANTLLCYPAGKKNETYTIPESVESIGDRAFYNCDNLSSVVISGNTTSIGNSVFGSCDNLEIVNIPNSVTSIGHSVFANCTSLTTITIPNSVKSIGESAFSGANLKSILLSNSMTYIDNQTFNGCIHLSDITIPNSITRINWRAFYGCTALTDVYYLGTQEQWNRISIETDNDPLLNATVHFNSSDANYFVVGRDSNQFYHNSYTCGFDNNSDSFDGVGYGYAISWPLYDKLAEGIKDKQLVALLDTIYGKWNGSCEGISLSMIMANTKRLTVSKINKEATCYHDFISPVSNPALKDIINYYQLLQSSGKLKHTKILHNNTDIKIPVVNTVGTVMTIASWDAFWDGFFESVKQADQERKPILFSFGCGKDEGHSVVACGIDESNHDYTVVKLYDCNSHELINNHHYNLYDGYLYLIIYKNSYTAFLSTTPTEPLSHQMNLYFSIFNLSDAGSNWTYVSYYDLETLNSIDSGDDLLSARPLSVCSDETSGIAFETEGFSTFSITNGEGKSLNFDGTTFSGNMELLDFDIIEGSTFRVQYTIPQSKSYILENIADSSRYSLISSDKYYSVMTENANTIRFDSEQIDIKGKEVTFDASISVMSDTKLKKLTGKSTDDCSVQELNNGVEIVSSGICEDIKYESITEESYSVQEASTPFETTSFTDPQEPSNPFTDVPDGKFFTDAVLWAVSQDPQITTGVTDTTFMPDRTCTRAHVVTFLWRANGCPEPQSTTNHFKDVPNGKYYTKAVLWAAEQEITTG